MVDTRHALGVRGELLASNYLRAQGWEVLGRNWSCRFGELDIIARQGEVLAFVEVRTVTRSTRQAVRPEETVDARKQRKLARAASCWLQAHDPADVAIRFDVIAVEIAHLDDPSPTLRHYAGAFEGHGLFC